MPNTKLLAPIANTILMILLLAAAVSHDGQLFGTSADEFETKETALITTPPSSEVMAEANYQKTHFSKRDEGVWDIINQENKTIGSVLATEQYAPDIYGYGGPIPMYLFIDPAGIITQVKILKNDESPSFLRKALAKGVVKQWIGKQVSHLSTFQPDAVTGATLSSNAINQSLTTSISHYVGSNLQGEKPNYFSLKNIAALLVLALGVYASFYKKENKKTLRMVLLVVNVVVLGFWCGTFISLGALLNLVHNGVHGASSLIFILLVALALIMPLFKKHKKYYCTWVCPYGSAQEIVGKLHKKKYQPSQKVMAYLKYSRRVITLGLYVAMWLGVSTDIMGFEPFAAFLFQNASWLVLTVAILGLISALFVPKGWCRFACPAGQTLDWSNQLD